jgi:hypothetical protein
MEQGRGEGVNSKRARERERRGVARVVLALLLLAMAAGQLADLPGFVEVLRDYDIDAVPLTWIIAIGLVVGEAIGGTLLLGGGTSTRASGAAVALAVGIVWSALALSAFARGEAIENCGCFGVYVAQPLRWWILLEDLEFLVLGAWVLLGGHRSASPGRGRPRTGFRTRTMQGASDVRAPQAR